MRKWLANHKEFHPSKEKSRCRFGPTLLAGRLMVGGTLLVSLGVCDVAARLFDALLRGDRGLFLRFDRDIEALVASVAILVGGVLLMDYCERWER